MKNTKWRISPIGSQHQMRELIFIHIYFHLTRSKSYIKNQKTLAFRFFLYPQRPITKWSILYCVNKCE